MLLNRLGITVKFAFIAYLLTITRAGNFQLVNFDEQPSGKDNNELLKDAVILLNRTVLIMQTNIVPYVTLIDSLVEKDCPSTYIDIFRSGVATRLIAKQDKLNTVLYILNRMTEVPLALEVQKYIDQCQQQAKGLDKITSNVEILAEYKTLTTENEKITKVLAVKLTDFANRNSTGLLGAVPCICVSKTVKAIDGLTMGKSLDNILTEILNPQNEPEQSLLLQLQDAVTGFNDSSNVILGAMSKIQAMLIAMNNSKCSSDYDEFFTTSLPLFFSPFKVKLPAALNIISKLNMTDAYEELQTFLNRATEQMNKLNDPSISSYGVESVFYSYFSLLRNFQIYISVNLTQSIDARQELESGCVCASYYSLTLLKLVVPFTAGLTGAVGNLVKGLLKIFVIALSTFSPKILLNLFASLSVGVAGGSPMPNIA